MKNRITKLPTWEQINNLDKISGGEGGDSKPPKNGPPPPPETD